MSLVGALRQVQLDIRLVQNQLQEINAEERNHPGKAATTDGGEKHAAWTTTKALFEKRRKRLKDRLAELQEERLSLEQKLDGSPMSKASIGYVLNQLVEIETKFTVDTWGDAWEALTAFIDWMEREEQRLAERPALKAVS